MQRNKEHEFFSSKKFKIDMILDTFYLILNTWYIKK